MRCWKIFEDVWKFFLDLGGCLESLEDVCKILKDFGRCWEVFGSTLGLFSDGLGRFLRKSSEMVKKC